MNAPQQHSIQDSPPDDLLAKLRGRLDYRWREVTGESAIDPAVVLERGYYIETSQRGLRRLGFSRSQEKLLPALVIPRYSPSGAEIPPQIKPDNPRTETADGRRRKHIKYETPGGVDVRLSVPPRCVPAMRDATTPLYITEGDKKADSLASAGVPALALQGVTCWHVLKDWEHISLADREVVIAYDADVMVNTNVEREISKLSGFLFERGAVVRYLNWPERFRGTKVGVDDFFAKGGTLSDLQEWTTYRDNDADKAIGTLLSEVKTEVVTWLWDRRIPFGKITVLDGDPDNGKSVLTTDLAARVTAGRNMPLDTTQSVAPGGVVILAAEDGVGDTIKPRFEAAGGDAARAMILGHDDPLGIPEDLPTIERAVERVGAKLLIIDPIMAFLGENINSNSDKDVRSALKPLKQLAERTECAVVIVRHLNKTGGGNAMYRGGGSIGIIGAARSGLMVAAHPEDEDSRVLASVKHNLSTAPESLSYRVISAPNNPNTAAIQYGGVVEFNARELLKNPAEESRSALELATDFIVKTLENGPVQGAKVLEDGAADGHSKITLRRAAKNLKVEYDRSTDNVSWWSLPTNDGGPDDDPKGVKSRDKVVEVDFESGQVGRWASSNDHDDHDDHDPPLFTQPSKYGKVGRAVIKDDHVDNGPPKPPYKNNNDMEEEVYLRGGDQRDHHQGVHPTHLPTYPPESNGAGLGQDEGDRDHDDNGTPTQYTLVSTSEGVDALLTELGSTSGPVALDTETFDPTGEDRALDVKIARVRLLQIRTSDGAPYLVDASAVDPQPVLDALVDRGLILHNAAYDLSVLRTNYGYIHAGPVSDTMLAGKVFHAGTHNSAGLGDLLSGLMEIEVDKEEQKSDWGGELTESQLEYAARDVEHLHELDEVLRTRVNNEGLADVVYLENRMVKVTAEMTALGMPVDEDIFAECVRISEEGIVTRTAELDALVTKPIPEKFTKANSKNKNVPVDRTEKLNWNSPPQVMWAFEAGGLKVKNTNKQTLADHEEHPLADALSALRKVGDIARRFKNAPVSNGRVHANWKQIEAATGRMACADPPLQGISRPLKRAFVAPEGHTLVVSDLSQIEIRVLCAISGDANLRQEFINGADVHTAVAANVLGVSREEVSSDQRKLAKSLVFGLLYGQGLKGFAAKAREVFKREYTEKDVERLFWKPFFEAYPGVAMWRADAINRFKQGRKDSYTKLGRRRLGLDSDRQALNSPIQGGAADVMKAIAVAVYKRRLEVPGLEIVGVVHDEILATVPQEHAAAAAALVRKVMKEVGEEVTNIGVEKDNRVPVEAVTRVCDCWAEKE